MSERARIPTAFAGERMLKRVTPRLGSLLKAHKVRVINGVLDIDSAAAAAKVYAGVSFLVRLNAGKAIPLAARRAAICRATNQCLGVWQSISLGSLRCEF